MFDTLLAKQSRQQSKDERATLSLQRKCQIIRFVSSGLEKLHEFGI